MHQLFKLRIIIFCALVATSMNSLIQVIHPPEVESHVIRYPIILIPGFAGSTLITSDQGGVYEGGDGHGGIFEYHYPANELVWINTSEAANLGFDDYFDGLKMKPDGVTPETSLYPRFPVPEVYQTTLDYFRAKGYRDGRDLFALAYDWRKDIRENHDRLDELITYAKQRAGLSKVNILAHSMGGLILRHYLTDSEKAQNIYQAVTLGTPYLGSPEYLKWLGYGGCLTSLNTGLPCIGIPASETKDIVQNFISGYQLLPSRKYYDFYNGHDEQHPMPFKDTRDLDTNGISGQLSYIQLKELLTNTNYNTNLFTPAEELHNQIDTTLPVILGGKLTLIVGSGQPTIGQIEEKAIVHAGDIEINKRDLHMINGDGSVPLFSASLDDSPNGQLLTGNAQVYYTKQNHNQLPQDENTLNFINFLFNNNPGETYSNTGVATQPFPLSGWLISVHSPVTLDLYDENNFHTGTLNDNVEQNVPYTYYNTLEDTKFIWVENIANYYLKFKATGAGAFDLKIREFQNNQIVKTILYEDIPLTPVTTAQGRLNTDNFIPPTIQLDKDNDGNFENLIQPTEISNTPIDTTAPTTSIKLEGPQGEHNWYKDSVTVDLAAQDNAGGSGVAKTEYSVNDGQIIPYTQPLHITNEGISKLSYYSEDKLGNKESTQEFTIKIDRSPPEAQILFDTTSLTPKVQGIDNVSSVTTSENNNTMTIVDEVGNTTRINYLPQNNKDKNRIELMTISYNDTLHTFSPNRFQSRYEIFNDTGLIKELEQKISIEGQEKVVARYNQKNGQTIIETKTHQEKKETYTIEGIQTIIMSTKKGVVYTNLNL